MYMWLKQMPSAIGTPVRTLPGILVMFILVFVLNGCASLPRTTQTELDQNAAQIEGFSDIRFWGDASAEKLKLDGPRLRPKSHSGGITYLALSGGGSGGAFGAGFLTGWTATGTRPEFDVVSGVSTGALIAPFAFIGASYDPALAELYTSGIAERLVTPSPLSVLFGTAASDSTALRQLVEHYATQDMLQKIATENAKGRHLFVVTTNLDAQRTVVWDMGAIAASGNSKALALFRDVLIASASIPAVFPPVMIDVTVDGRHFQEMHSDGGATTELFTAPEIFLTSTDISPPIKPQTVDLYIIVNSTLDPEFEIVKPSTIAIAGRAYSTLVKMHTRSAVNATYTLAQRTGINFDLTYLDEAVPYKMTDPFNTEYMNRLFRIGLGKALSAHPWREMPPVASD